MGLFRADSGFYDKAIVGQLKAKKISHIISARLTQALQQAIMDQCKWQQLEAGLEVCELNYQPHGWDGPQRLVVVRKNGVVAGKTLLLFADDADLQGWRYGVMLTDLSITALELWHLHRGRAPTGDVRRRGLTHTHPPPRRCRCIRASACLGRSGVAVWGPVWRTCEMRPKRASS